MRQLHKLGIGSATVIVIILAAFVGTNALLDSGAAALKVGDGAGAMRRLKILAFLGHTTAQELVGSLYAFGWDVPRNDDEAIKWFRRAARGTAPGEDPAAVAEYYVGDSYANGVQVAKSEEDALKWFRRSAEGGYAKAQERLAQIYEDGIYGVARDPDQARYWRTRAGTRTNQ